MPKIGRPRNADGVITSDGYRRIMCRGGMMHKPLTEREKQVLHCVVQGMENKEIAGVLFMSDKTVKQYVSRLFFKYHVHNRTALAVYALRNGLER